MAHETDQHQNKRRVVVVVVVVVAVVVVVLVVLVFVVVAVVVGRKRRARDSHRFFCFSTRAPGAVVAPRGAGPVPGSGGCTSLGRGGGPPHTTRTGECRTARVTGSCLRKRHWQHTA